MNLRKKITIASILMILIPLIVSVSLCVIVVFYKGDSTLNRLKSLYENDNGLLSVQTILYSYESRILSYTPLEYDEEGDDEDDEEDDDEDGDDEEDDDEDDIEESAGRYGGEGNRNYRIGINRESSVYAFGNLIKELRVMRYYYQIRYEDQIVLSNLPEGAQDEIRDLAGKEYMTVRNFAVTDGEKSVVKRTYSDGDKTLDVMAYCAQYDSGSHISRIIRDFFVLVLLFMIVFTVTIIISIFVLTKWLSGGMRSSLMQLSEAVRQVQDGNLSYRIHSRKKDELGKACQEFDEMTEYLENSVNEREKYEESRKRMLAGISHDLRTPLTSLKAYVEGLKDGIANTEEKRQRYYNALKIRTADLEALIDNLSLFSEFDREEYPFSMERMEFGEFLSHFFQENAVELLRNHITLEWGVPSGENLYIDGDEKQLRRMLGNLIDNILKYREKGETVLKTALYSEGNRVVLEVEDDGPGVPAEERELIFDTFYRGDKARSNPGSGSGLGLSVVKEILKGHQATICAAEGRNGKGLRLIMKFPLQNGDKEA